MNEPSQLEYTARELLERDSEFRAHVAQLSTDDKLGKVWSSVLDGHGCTAQDAKLLLIDILLVSGYFEIAPEDATDRSLQRREGKREIAARILFLSDLPGSYITQLRRDALDELQKMEARER